MQEKVPIILTKRHVIYLRRQARRQAGLANSETSGRYKWRSTYATGRLVFYHEGEATSLSLAIARVRLSTHEYLQRFDATTSRRRRATVKTTTELEMETKIGKGNGRQSAPGLSLVNQTTPFPSSGCDAIHPALGKGVVWFTRLALISPLCINYCFSWLAISLT